MSEKIQVPVLGESITEATVSKWLKKKGDLVKVDEPIVELETDKVNLEVPSPISGTLIEIISQEGSAVEVGAVLGLVDENEDVEKTNEKIEKIKPTVQKENIENSEPQQEEPKLLETEVTDELEKKEELLVLTKEVETNPAIKEKLNEQVLSPAVRKIVAENKINLETIKGSGKDGRLLKGDLINLMSKSPPPSERKVKYGQEERIKMTRLRQTIAKRLKQAQENAALLTTFNEVDMTNIIKMRKNNQDDFQNRFGIKLGMMSFFVKASIVALKNFPAVNAEIEGDEII